MKLLTIILIVFSATLGFAQDFDQAIEQVGVEYAREYTRPLIDAFGINQNSALYTTADIPVAKIKFSFGLKAMNTMLEDADQHFEATQGVILDESFGVNPDDPYYGEPGFIYMDGPTVFGNETTPGQLIAYYEGVPVANAETITGVMDTKNVPLVLPEFTIGGVAGLKGVVRWLPEIDGGDMGKISYSGIGLQYNVNNLFTAILPVDLMVGFFNQNLTIGDYVDANAASYHAVVSKGFGVLTGYAGYAYEASSVDVEYDMVTDSGDSYPVSFSADGVQTSRTTVGATFNMGLKLNAEASFGEKTNISAGLLLGF